MGNSKLTNDPNSSLEIAGARGQEAVAVYFPQSRNTRRFALVSNVLAAMRIHHVAVIPLLQRKRFGGLVKTATSSPYCRTVFWKPASANIVIGEADRIPARSLKSARKTLFLSYDTRTFLNSEKRDDSFFHPILFHPNMITQAAYRRADELARNTERPVGILFGGNCDEATYTSSNMALEYGILNRIEISRLAKRMPDDKVFFPTSRDAFETALGNGELKNRLVWIDTTLFRIPQAEWLNLVSKSRFFICTPGVRYPYCQNLNEAMACGSVPLLQFPDAYYPPLVNGENCLSFRSDSDFSGKVVEALKMDHKHWMDLQKRSIGYHEDHLSLNALAGRLKAFFGDPERRAATWVLAGKGI